MGKHPKIIYAGVIKFCRRKVILFGKAANTCPDRIPMNVFELFSLVGVSLFNHKKLQFPEADVVSY
jgi:hypothetical protein